MSQSLSNTDLILRNLTTNQLVPSTSISLSYDLTTNTATFTFASILADGNYRTTLSAGCDNAGWRPGPSVNWGGSAGVLPGRPPQNGDC